MRLNVRDLVSVLDAAFPFSWAEPWDNVGLLVGDPRAEVTGIYVTLDATRFDVERALEAGANVLLTHHPAFLTPPATLEPGNGPGGVAYAAAQAGVALVSCHTNLDRSPAGAASLAAKLGFEAGEPVEGSLQPVMLVTTFVPAQARAAVSRAMAAAGAGRIGLYEECSFTLEGTGRYTALPGSDPHTGVPDGTTGTAEERIEMVCAPGDAARIVEAARSAHPYQEPLIIAAEGSILRGIARLGRVIDLDEPRPLSELARQVVEATGSTPRVWGDRDGLAARVATATGSASGLLSDVMASGADTLIAGEVRYHDALTACRSGLAIIELGHDVSEWPLVPVLADAVRPACGDVPLVVQSPHTVWWSP